jgi:hypothetical protein
LEGWDREREGERRRRRKVGFEVGEEGLGGGEVGTAGGESLAAGLELLSFCCGRLISSGGDLGRCECQLTGFVLGLCASDLFPGSISPTGEGPFLCFEEAFVLYAESALGTSGQEGGGVCGDEGEVVAELLSLDIVLFEAVVRVVLVSPRVE